MGRTVENAFLAAAARETGATRLVGEYAPTAKNAPVKDLYARLGFAHVRDDGDRRVWRLDDAGKLEIPPWFQIRHEQNGAAHNLPVNTR
jgi:predicted enzyme involved in methoxymalonyl-ACP biosynthesis